MSRRGALHPPGERLGALASFVSAVRRDEVNCGAGRADCVHLEKIRPAVEGKESTASCETRIVEQSHLPEESQDAVQLWPGPRTFCLRPGWVAISLCKSRPAAAPSTGQLISSRCAPCTRAGKSFPARQTPCTGPGKSFPGPIAPCSAPWKSFPDPFAPCSGPGKRFPGPKHGASHLGKTSRLHLHRASDSGSPSQVVFTVHAPR
jgi:hypothetical protein